jgi:Acyl-CoA dehydrogenase, N-terminal domain
MFKPVDMTDEQLVEHRRRKKNERRRSRRGRTRAEYLAECLSTTKPWEAGNQSRRELSMNTRFEPQPPELQPPWRTALRVELQLEARAFARDVVLPIADELDPQKAEMPRRLIDQMAAKGWFGITGLITTQSVEPTCLSKFTRRFKQGARSANPVRFGCSS